MRHYPSDSPKAMGRLVAMTLMADGAIDSSELKLLDRKNTIHRLGLNHDSFDNLIHELCDDMLASAHRTPAGHLELDRPSIDLLLAEVKHPFLQKQVLRMMLDVVNADHKLSGGEAVLIAEAMRFWGIDLYEVSDNSISGSGSHKGDPAKPTHVQH
jgi:uncharacterized tellurite resistance protein B-like protein